VASDDSIEPSDSEVIDGGLPDRDLDAMPDLPFERIKGYGLAYCEKYVLSYTKGKGEDVFSITVGTSQRKLVESFPLTEEGWNSAFSSFASLEPYAAERVRSRLRRDSATEEDAEDDIETSVRTVKAQAEKAFNEGRSIFVTRSRSTTFQRLGENLSGDSHVAAIIEAVESEGWRLEQMSHYPFVGLATVHEFGIYVFRRGPRLEARP
jgi:hypothetical protein